MRVSNSIKYNRM